MPEDIRISLSFKNNRKRKKLFKKLGADGIISLIDLWLSVAENRPSGILTGYDQDDIEIDACWNGKSGDFFKAILECKFINENNGVYEMHNWSTRQSWVFASENRSDKARFSRMAKTHKDLYEKLKSEDVNAISKIDYVELTNAQRSVNESLTDRERTVEEVVTPAPAPAPSPDPSPTPIVNINLLSDSKESDESIEMKLTIYLFKHIQKNNPNVKEPNYKKWSLVIDRMIRLDKRKPDDIKEMIQWCQGDDFWCTNILSTEKLRKQWDQMYLKKSKDKSLPKNKQQSQEEQRSLYNWK